MITKTGCSSALFGFRRLAQPRVPFFEPFARAARNLKEGQIRIEVAGMAGGNLYIEIYIGQEIDLVEDHRTGTVEKERVFFRLVVAFGHAEQGDLGVFAAIEFDGANEVPYVFDEQDIDLKHLELP